MSFLVRHKKNTYTSPAENLIAILAKLPGLGTRSATRMAYHILMNPEEVLDPILHRLTDLRQIIRHCADCGNLAFAEKCEICEQPERDRQVICVVEKAQNIRAIEKSGAYYGLYHVLGGLLSIFDGVTPDALHVQKLKNRIIEHHIKEVIFALPATQDGRTTLYYITDILADSEVTMTIPAQGMPLGSDLDYLDQGTVMTAFNARKAI